MSKKRVHRTDVPPGLRVQLGRLFGTDSWEAKTESRTTAQWKRTLKKILAELDRYLAANVRTDEVHRLMLCSGLAAAHEALEQPEFWSGYIEGIVRFALLLLGDYPDHRRRKGRAKSGDYYKLDRCRSLHFMQSEIQKYCTLNAAESLGTPSMSRSVRDALNEFRHEHGFEPELGDFFRWYRERYPQDYAAVF